MQLPMPTAPSESLAQRAASDTANVYKNRPVGVVMATVALDAAAVVLLLSLSAGVAGAVGGALAGTALVLFLIFLWALTQAQVRQLEERVAEFQETLSNQQTYIQGLIEDRWGDVDQFVPTYHDLRSDLQEAIRKVRRANETAELWAYADTLDNSTWKRKREALGTHPWARADNVYGPCADAFGHVERLNALSGLRFRRRTTRSGDDLEPALESMEEADRQLAAAIARANPDQPEFDGVGTP